MREITETKRLYQYNELSESAKENARQKMCETMRDSEVYYYDLMYALQGMFPKSKMEVQFSLFYCQGDGLNVYGTIAVKDFVNYLLENTGGNFTKDEKRFLVWLSNRDFDIKMDANNRYCYYLDKCNDIVYYIEDDLENDYLQGIPYGTINKAARIFNCLLKTLCGKWENDGYEWFYEYSDDDAQEDANANEWEFLEDGSIYW